MHKQIKNRLPTFCSILSAVGTPTCKLAKFLLYFLTHFVLLEKFLSKTLIYIWLVEMLIPYILILHWTKLLVFVFIVCIMIDGVAIGSPLGSALVNIFVSRFENKWLKDCFHGFKPVFYRY